jgi:hypothetical protein
VLFYRTALPLSSKTLTFVSGIIRRHRASIGSRGHGAHLTKALIQVRSSEIRHIVST